MSLYANINVSKTQAQNAPTNNNRPPTQKPSKSAALYAGVLAEPAPPINVIPHRQELSPEVVPQPINIEPEQSKEASGTFHREHYR
jgi:hypothetical protein